MPRILLGFIGGLYALEEESGALRVVLGGLQPLAIALDPTVSGRVFCATYDRGLWRSDNFGESWAAVGAPGSYFEPRSKGGIEERATTFVSVASAPPSGQAGVVWVGTEPGRLYRSDDGGDSFTCVTDWADLPSREYWSFPPRPDTCNVRWIAHGEDGSVHVSIEYGAVLRSRDGCSFSDRLPDSPKDAHVLLTHPKAPSRVYAALGDGVITRGRSWATSEDGGQTWRYISAGLESAPYLFGLALNPVDPNDIRVAASRDPITAHRSGPSSIFRWAEDRWEEDAEGFPGADSLVPVLAADPRKEGRWFALSNLGLFEQQNGAWSPMASLSEWRDRHPTCIAVL